MRRYLLGPFVFVVCKCVRDPSTDQFEMIEFLDLEKGWVVLLLVFECIL